MPTGTRRYPHFVVTQSKCLLAIALRNFRSSWSHARQSHKGLIDGDCASNLVRVGADVAHGDVEGTEHHRSVRGS